MIRVEKLCEECGRSINGRSDKKFCSDQCRTTFNNRRNSIETNHIRRVNTILRKNRRILEELSPQGKTKVNRGELTLQGFDFRYHTMLHKTRNGSTYYFCYERGYLEIDNNTFLLVVREEV